MPVTHRLLRPAALVLLALGLAACAHRPDSGTPASAADVLPLFDGQVAPGWQVVVEDFEARQTLTGTSVSVPKPAQPRVPDSQVEARLSAHQSTRDALSLQFKQAWYAGLKFEGGAPLDLRPFLAEGTLELELKVDEMARGGLTFVMGCGKDCQRKVPFILPSRALAGQGWQHLSLALRCFVREGDDLSAVAMPFLLGGSGVGEASIAKVRFVRRGQPNTACPDYRTESVTPSPLNQVWALEWWMKRHEDKLAQIQAAKASGQLPQLIFIGDSITHGWEDAGKKTWESEYGRYHPLDLGFGGDHTENVLWRLQHGEVDGIAPKVAVLMIGTNNTGDRGEDPRTTAAGIRRILAELRQRLPNTRILLLAIFPRDEQASSPLRQLNEQVNALIQGEADGQHIFFLNINAQLMKPDGSLSKEILPDLLHLSDTGYALWARSMAPTLNDLLSRP